MIDKNKISKGKREVPLKVLVLGQEGVGKTTFASGAPDPFFLDLDGGSHERDVKRATNIETFDELLEWVEAPEGESLVIDSLSRVEALITTKVCGKGGNLAEYGGGYGKGDAAANQHWRHLIGMLDRVNRTKNVILIGHVNVKRFDSPTGESYDRFQLSLREGAAGTVKQWVNYTLFCRAEIVTRVQEKSKKTLADSTGERWIYTDTHPAYDAKHRGNLPARLPMTWKAFAGAVAADKEPVDFQLAKIRALCPPELKERVDQAIGRGTPLIEILTHLQATVTEIKETQS